MVVDVDVAGVVMTDPLALLPCLGIRVVIAVIVSYLTWSVGGVCEFLEHFVPHSSLLYFSSAVRTDNAPLPKKLCRTGI